MPKLRYILTVDHDQHMFLELEGNFLIFLSDQEALLQGAGLTLALLQGAGLTLGHLVLGLNQYSF